MKAISPKDSGWRGSQAGWIEAAQQALLDGGVEAVRVLPLAKKLGLSRTSFYWFFNDRDEMLMALLKRWRDKNTGSIVSQSKVYAETVTEAMLNIMDCWLNRDLFDAQFEFAVRSWALQSSVALKEVRRADSIRLDALRTMLRRFGQPELTADVRARTIYLVQIGYISMQTRETLDVRMKRMPEYVAIFTGSRPAQRELEGFHARHGYLPS